MTAISEDNYPLFDGYLYVGHGQDWVYDFADEFEGLEFHVDSLGPPYRRAMAEEAKRLSALPAAERAALFMNHTYGFKSPQEVEAVFVHALRLLGLPPLDA